MEEARKSGGSRRAKRTVPIPQRAQDALTSLFIVDTIALPFQFVYDCEKIQQLLCTPGENILILFKSNIRNDANRNL